MTNILGGRLSIDSEIGLGTAFRLHLPLSPVFLEATHIPRAEEKPKRVTFVGLPAPTALSAAMMLYHAGIDINFASIGERLKSPGIILAGANLPSTEIARLAISGPTLVVLRPEDRAAINKFRLLGCAGWMVRPMRRKSLLERVTLAHAGKKNLGEDNADTELAGARVLIADDNAVNLLIARRALEKSGFAVTLAATGVEALEAAQAMQYALILMDLRMPVMDGFESMRRLRKDGHTTPIIAVSAEINPQIEARARECGANAVAAKPLDAGALRTLAQTWATLPKPQNTKTQKGAA